LLDDETHLPTELRAEAEWRFRDQHRAGAQPASDAFESRGPLRRLWFDAWFAACPVKKSPPRIVGIPKLALSTRSRALEIDRWRHLASTIPRFIDGARRARRCRAVGSHPRRRRVDALRSRLVDRVPDLAEHSVEGDPDIVADINWGWVFYERFQSGAVTYAPPEDWLPVRARAIGAEAANPAAPPRKSTLP